MHHGGYRLSWLSNGLRGTGVMTFNALKLYNNKALQQTVCVCSPQATGRHSKHDLVNVDQFRREPYSKER